MARLPLSLLMMLLTVGQSSCRKFIKGVNMFQMEVVEAADETEGCLEGWEQYEQNCYKIFDGEDSLAYYEAQRHCEEFGGSLPSIHSEGENQFIYDFWRQRKIEVNPYIGLYWDTTSLAWLDESPVSYTRLFQSYNESREVLVYCIQTRNVEGKNLRLWKTYFLEQYRTKKDPFICKAFVHSMKIPSVKALQEDGARKLDGNLAGHTIN